MIAMVFPATVINYLDRQTLSVAAPVLTEQFDMSNVEYSRVVSAFMLAYTIMNGVSGPLIDRLGTKLGYALCIAWWSAASMLHALARGPLSLGVFRFLLGMGEAGNWPAGVKVVAEWFPVGGARFRFGHLQQRLGDRRHHRAAAGGLDRAAPVLARGVPLDWRHRFRVAAGLVAHLLHARRGRAGGHGATHSGVDAAPYAVGAALHALEDLLRPRLVLLHILVPAISQNTVVQISRL
jgi:MFS family permease